MVVVLPAPFGPRKPVIRPGSTVKDSWSTASLSPNRLVRPRASIIAGSFLGGAGTMPVRRVRPVFRGCRGCRVGRGADSYPPKVVGRTSTWGRPGAPGSPLAVGQAQLSQGGGRGGLVHRTRG